MLVTEAGEEVVRAGDRGVYPDIDLTFAPGRTSGRGGSLHRDRTKV